jgi:hypothetical protein
MRKFFLAAFLTVATATPIAADEYQAGTQPRTIPPANLTANDNQLPVTLTNETDPAFTKWNDTRYGNNATFGGAQLERAAYCLGCHIASSVDSPGRTWEGSMMANAARDPLMYAALAVANADIPGVGGDYCLRCHSPSGFTMGHTMMNPPATFNGTAIAADTINNPNRYPCNQYEPGSMTLCKCLAPSNDCTGARATMRDYCTESDPQRVANGYCMINFGDNATAGFKGHPDAPDFYHDEAYEQLYTGQLDTNNLTEADTNGTADPADDAEGLQCSFCHRLDPAKNGTTRVYGGNYWLSSATTWPANSWVSPRTVRFGPYTQSYTNCTNSNTTNPGVDCDSTSGQGHRHGVQPSALHTSSTLCGICHDVTNPALVRLNSDGSTRMNPATGLSYHMPVERTFSEWNASVYGPGGPVAQQRNCQSCHMPQPAQPTSACLALGGGPGTLPYNRPLGDGTAATPGFPRHIFVGGNVWIPSVFRDIIQPVAGAGDPLWLYNLVTIPDNVAGNVQRQQNQAYDATVTAAKAMLQSAATLTFNGTPPATARSGDSIGFSVRVLNTSGHKLPTGYPEGRRMWLQVSATVPSDASMPPPFFQSGAWDPATGLLTRDTQLKIYEVALGRMGATMEPYPTQFHFVTNQIVFQDNRIPPAGFDTTNPKFDEMAPVPASLYPPTTPNGTVLRNWDDTSYTIAIPATATGDVQVTVTLLYQTASKDYVDFLQANGPRVGNAVTRGDDIKTVWLNHEKSAPVVMATQMFTVQNTAPFVPPPDMSGAVPPDLSGAVEDLAIPAYDMEIVPNPKKPKHGCGISVVGADWTDLGPLASLLVAGVLFSRRRKSGARG